VARALLRDILVEAPPGARALVTFGDSITDGDCSTIDSNRRWPDVLAERLVRGGRFSRGRAQPGHLGRQGAVRRAWASTCSLDSIATSSPRPHVDTVIVMIGINDIGCGGRADAVARRPARAARAHHRRATVS
jgi:lysophospholipase L1-like esterase